eukprot:SAG31_NODE_48819_length_167_cov_2.985294_1_plen_33_part_01
MIWYTDDMIYNAEAREKEWDADRGWLWGRNRSE